MKRQSGFTLIEVMVVVAVIAILAAIAIPNYNSYRKTSQMKSCLSNLGMLDSATSSYLLRNGIPEDSEVTMDMLAPPTEGANKEKYFIVHLPVCPSGGEYRYNSSAQGWYCTLGGASDANDGYPHGAGKR